jgi:thiamine-phosphate diphosphorylase/hydroxyethylthiazole kinase
LSRTATELPFSGSAITVYTGAASQSAKQTYENESQIVQGDIFAATIAGILVINVAAEIAAARSDVKGPNTFRSALIDELYNLRADALLERAKVEVVGS